jgi:hypothetical protein
MSVAVWFAVWFVGPVVRKLLADPPVSPGVARGPSTIVAPVSRASATSRRRALRAAVVTASLIALAAVPAAAMAGPLDDTPGKAHPLGLVNGLLIFLVAPVGVFLIVAVLTLRPGSAPKAQRYRPGKDWSAAPSWTGVQPPREATHQAPFAGAGEPVTLPAGGRHAHVPVMDGAPHQEHADTQADHDALGHENDPAPVAETATPGDSSPPSTGGASGSW